MNTQEVSVKIQELTVRIRFWLREGEGLACREGNITESVSPAEWQAPDDAASAIVENIVREIALSWKRTRAKVTVYLPYQDDLDVHISILQEPRDRAPSREGTHVVFLHPRDVEDLAKFVEEVLDEAKGSAPAVC